MGNIRQQEDQLDKDQVTLDEEMMMGWEQEALDRLEYDYEYQIILTDTLGGMNL